MAVCMRKVLARPRGWRSSVSFAFIYLFIYLFFFFFFVYSPLQKRERTTGKSSVVFHLFEELRYLNESSQLNLRVFTKNISI